LRLATVLALLGALVEAAPAEARSMVLVLCPRAMPRYAVFFTLKAEAIALAMQQPSDRVAVVSKAVESAGQA
jgi:hypothetical protein